MIQESEASVRTILLETFARLVAYGLLMILLIQLMTLDAGQQDVEMKFMESTFTEWTQQLCLFILAAIFAHCAYHYLQFRCLSILLAGMATIGLVREFNNFFKANVFDGAWQMVVFTVAIITSYFIWKNRQGFWSAFDQFRQSFSFGLMMAGFLITFIFSRLYGRHEFWITLMEDRYFRSVKNASEESIELLGYGLMLIASIEFFILVRSISLTETEQIDSID
jgi:hypothetical protein